MVGIWTVQRLSVLEIRDQIEPALKNIKQTKTKAAAVVDLVGTPSSKGHKGRKKKTPELVILLNSSGEEEPTPKAT